MNLSVHLTELLKTNDCVIVPDLGGFIANFQTSGYDPEENKFSPPSKEIIFSSKLKKNDGLLVNYVSEKEGVGYLEARKIVSEFVSECLFKLENGERIEFEKIGVLKLDENDHMVFEAEKGFILRLDTFGLDSFHFPQIQSTSQAHFQGQRSCASTTNSIGCQILVGWITHFGNPIFYPTQQNTQSGKEWQPAHNQYCFIISN
jgi:hypothetical protein